VTLEHTDDRSKRFMRDPPFDLRFELAGKRVRLVHGSPRKVNEYLLEERAASTFERIARLADSDILLFGHTHKPWVREYGGVLFVNCGSVGKPKDGDPRGSFALLEEQDGDVNVSIERVAYDAQAVATEIRNAGLPYEVADQLVRAEEANRRRNASFGLDLRSFRVVARRIRDRSALGVNRLEIAVPRVGFGPLLAVSWSLREKSV
jgi:diadenosine tetraphosphatase ApaH/serine/threonine PP2A family protein phosphatase